MIKEFIENLPDDKRKHVVLGQIMASFITPMVLIVGFAFYFLLPIEVLIEFIFFTATFVFIIGTLLNAWKEIIHDFYQEKGTPEWNDFLATEIPLLTSYLPYLILFIFITFKN